MKNYFEYFVKKKYCCIDCDYIINKKISLYNYLESYKLISKVEKVIECDECGKYFFYVGVLFIYKMVYKEKGVNKMYKCKFCEYEIVE